MYDIGRLLVSMKILLGFLPSFGISRRNKTKHKLSDLKLRIYANYIGFY